MSFYIFKKQYIYVFYHKRYRLQVLWSFVVNSNMKRNCCSFICYVLMYSFVVNLNTIRNCCLFVIHIIKFCSFFFICFFDDKEKLLNFVATQLRIPSLLSICDHWRLDASIKSYPLLKKNWCFFFNNRNKKGTYHQRAPRQSVHSRTPTSLQNRNRATTFCGPSSRRPPPPTCRSRSRRRRIAPGPPAWGSRSRRWRGSSAARTGSATPWTSSGARSPSSCCGHCRALCSPTAPGARGRPSWVPWSGRRRGYRAGRKPTSWRFWK